MNYIEANGIWKKSRLSPNITPLTIAENSTGPCHSAESNSQCGIDIVNLVWIYEDKLDVHYGRGFLHGSQVKNDDQYNLKIKFGYMKGLDGPTSLEEYFKTKTKRTYDVGPFTEANGYVVGIPLDFYIYGVAYETKDTITIGYPSVRKGYKALQVRVDVIEYNKNKNTDNLNGAWQCGLWNLEPVSKETGSSGKKETSPLYVFSMILQSIQYRYRDSCRPNFWGNLWGTLTTKPVVLPTICDLLKKDPNKWFEKIGGTTYETRKNPQGPTGKLKGPSTHRRGHTRTKRNRKKLVERQRTKST